jgi:aspartate/methionine/tyrosine aminotransferase
LDTFPLFDADGFNVAGLRERLFARPPGKRVVLLNFPNNPTGYTCSPEEAAAIRGVLVEAAEAGCEVVVIIDDAYFGLVYEDGVLTESIFGALVDAHERLLAVKIDGATKEDYAWGFRVGFLTYGFRGADAAALDALAQKTAGLVRGSISNASHLSQSLLLTAYNAPEYAAWKAEKFAILARRYQRTREVLAAHPEYAERFEPLPCNSGYFMCVRPRAGDAEAIRQRLLTRYDTGLIATAGLLRIAFSSVPTASIDALFANLYAAIGDEMR